MQRLKTTRLCLTLAVGVWVALNLLPAADGFMAYDHGNPKSARKKNNLIRRVHKNSWTIGYKYGDDCPPEKRNNSKAIEAAITTALNAWLQPVRDLNTGKQVVSDFDFVLNPVIKKDADVMKYDLLISFYCTFGTSEARVSDRANRPPYIKMRGGTDVNYRFLFVLLHELGHAFGLIDTYPKPKATRNEFRVSKGGLERTIGHQPSSVMSVLNAPSPLPSRISEDDARGIVWLYKFYRENLPIKDCIFLDYELERAPHGCRPKSPLLFEIKYGSERLALAVMNEDENTDVNAQDRQGRTALHYAVLGYEIAIVERLLAHEKINVNLKDKDGLTPYQLAVELGYQRLIQIIPRVAKLQVSPKERLTTTWAELKQRE